MSFKQWFSGMCLLLVTTGFAAAQTQITSGVIEGVAVDSSDAVIPGVTVEVRNTGTNLSRSLVTNGDGRFSALQLASGRYTVSLTLTGFATLVLENVDVTVGQVNVLFHQYVTMSQMGPV